MNTGRTFAGSTSAYLETTVDIPARGYPLTVSVIFDPNSLHFGTLWALNNSAVADNTIRLMLDSSGHVECVMRTPGNADTAAITTNAYATGEWFVATGVWASITDRRAFLNGTGKGTNATNTGDIVWANLDRHSLGVDRRSTPQDPFNGNLQYVAVWRAALDDAEVAALGEFMDPRLIRPEALIRLYPIIGRKSTMPEYDVVGMHAPMLTPAGVTAITPVSGNRSIQQERPFYQSLATLSWSKQRRLFAQAAAASILPPGRIALQAVNRAASY